MSSWVLGTSGDRDCLTLVGTLLQYLTLFCRAASAACTAAWDPFRDARYHTCSCWIEWDSAQFISPACPGLSEKRPPPPVCLFTAAPNLGPCTSLMRGHSIPFSCSLLKTLNGIDPTGNPWGTPPATGYLLDSAPLVTMFWLQHCSQFFTHPYLILTSWIWF